jgi:hypothetical protein
MDLWRVLLWSLIILGSGPTLYGLHRLCLWLEDRGLLYYKHKKPSSSAAGCLVGLQKALEPQAQHVLQIKEEDNRLMFPYPGVGRRGAPEPSARRSRRSSNGLDCGGRRVRITGYWEEEQ